MFGSWQTHDDYIALLRSLDARVSSDSLLAQEWAARASVRRKLRNLNLDPVRDFLTDFFPDSGRPANCQAQTMRSFVLMSLSGFTSITKWVHALHDSPILAFLAGCDPGGLLGNPIPIPSIGSHYAFIDRFWSADSFERQHSGRSLEALLPPKFYSALKQSKDAIDKAKKEGSLKKDVKLQESNPMITQTLTNWASTGRDFPLHFEINLQNLFFLVAVGPSIASGLISLEDLTLSGDGTALHIHSDPNGHRPHSDDYQAIDYDSCPRFFQDPEANFGWDSDLGVAYYGYTLYLLCVHNPDLAVDLPVHIRLTSAARNDAVTGIVALHEFMQAHPDIPIKNLCLDSAHDNYPTYRWLLSKHIRPFIDLNDQRGRKKSVEGESTKTDPDNKVIPICQAGLEMVREGNDYSRMRTKYRCPLKCGKIDSCPYEIACCKTEYGRTVYVNMADNPRFNTPVPRGTDQYKEIYNNRTTCERCNKRMLHDYHLEQWFGHSRRRASFMSMLAGICIHLDAQVKAEDMKVA